MSDLRQLQLRFQRYLTDDNQAFFKDIVSTENAQAKHRLAAYYNAYRIRLIDCLANDFSTLYDYLGTQKFEQLMLEYLKHYPSSKPSVRWIGQNLSHFISQQSEIENSALLVELSQFEWNQSVVFFAKAATNTFQMDAMAMIPAESWPSIQIQFQPGLLWMDCHWNVTQVALASENDSSGNESPTPEPAYSEIATRWLIWRKEFTPNWRSLDVHEAWALEAAFKGASFAELCEGLLEWIDAENVAITAAGFLKQWISDELIEDIHF